jgi:hypothetical protein
VKLSSHLSYILGQLLGTNPAMNNASNEAVARSLVHRTELLEQALDQERARAGRAIADRDRVQAALDRYAALFGPLADV